MSYKYDSSKASINSHQLVHLDFGTFDLIN